ncbi:MAG: phosphoglucomutase [Elusimicrobiaceae bacterium]|nr:phosphoglucomutase [Elusimicrobiaceae bacterium]
MIHENAGKLPTQKIDLVALEKAFYNAQNPKRVKFGTSGHRGQLGDGFCKLHALSIAQAVAKMHKEDNVKGKILVGGDTRLMSRVTAELCAQVLTANGFKVILPSIPVPTPVFSFEILEGRACACLNGTASHNPPQDMGLKYNGANGGPAGSEITTRIEKDANYFLTHPAEIKQISLEEARKLGLLEDADIITPYIKALGKKIDFDIIKNAKIHTAIHPLGGTTLPFWQAIKKEYKLDNLDIVSHDINPTFDFIPLDHDGKTRMDPSSPYPMAPLLKLVENAYQFAGACDPDGDRFGSATQKGGLIVPNHALCVMADYLIKKQKDLTGKQIGRTLGTTMLLDKIAEANKISIDEVNVGFKYFVKGLSEGRYILAGEESAGMSVAKWTTEKDGMFAVCLLLEIMSATGQDIAGLYKQLTLIYGEPSYTRIDNTVTEESKARFAKFSADTFKALQTIAGERVLKIRATDGIKIYLENSWVLARMSGTEPIIKLYAETFKGKEHLQEIIKESSKLFGF